jgi:hypothetical protein
MNPLVLKVGIPVLIIAALAFMRWTNKKSMGEPFFPTSEDSGTKSKSGGGGGAAIDIGQALNTPQEVIGGDTFASTSEDTTVNPDNSPPTSGDVLYTTATGYTTQQQTPDYGLKTLVSPQQAAASGLPVGPHQISNLPVFNTPTTNPPINQFGGGASAGKTFAM